MRRLANVTIVLAAILWGFFTKEGGEVCKVTNGLVFIIAKLARCKALMVVVITVGFSRKDWEGRSSLCEPKSYFRWLVVMG